jgi:hypothetical protein
MRLAALAFVLAGCNQILGIGDLHTGSGSGGPGTPDGPPSPDQLHGTSQITWLHPSGAPTVADEDLSAYTVRALVKDDTATGGFRSIAGTGGAGTFSVPVTVDGSADVYLELTRPGTPTHALYRVDRNALDAGYPTLGHPSASITAKTPITIDVTGLQAWSGATDQFHLASYGAGADGSFPLGFANLPVDGVTSTTTTTFDWSYATVADPGGAPPRALDATQGDELWIAHMRARTVDVTAPQMASVSTIADSIEVPSLAMSDGTPVTAMGAMTPTNLTHAQDFALDLGQFFAARPSLTTEQAWCYRYASPGADKGLALGIPVWNLTLTLVPAQSLLGLKTMPYADPFPSAWPAMIQCDVWTATMVPISGFGNLAFQIHDYVAAPAGANVTVQPTLTPPTDATFGGVDFATGGTVTSNGKPITIAWSASPWATQYHLDIRKIVKTATPPVVVVATIDTTDTHVDLPLDVITPGSYYVISLWSVKATDGLPSGQLRETGPYAERAMSISQGMLVQ